MSRFFTSQLDNLVPYTPGEQPQGMQTMIKLNTNESPFAPSPAVLAAVAAQPEALRLYPDPTCHTFLKALAKTLGVKETQVFAGNGSDEVLAFAFRAFCEQGAAFPDVTYGFYPVFARLFGVPYAEIPLREDFSIAVKDYAERQETVFLANPNAPTGLCLPLAEIETLLRQNKNRLVVVDEAYVDFGGESATALLDDYENLLVVGTFSKSRSLAGARIGYAVGSPALIADLNTIKFSFNPYNLSRTALAAGTAALQDADYFACCVAQLCLTRDDTAAALRAMGFTLTQSRANFLFAAPPAPLSAENYCAFLRKNNILVRYFGTPRTKNYVRITIGYAQQMQTLLEVTAQWLEEEKA